ncbi:MAG: S8 family serine peptidase [Rhodanobacter sp.]
MGKSYDRFIISYRKGSAEAGDSTRVLQSVDVAMSRGGLTGIVTRSIGTGTTRSYLRKLATGADLVRTPQMTESEATTFMQALASEPDVAHVEPDVMMHAVHDYRSSFTQVADFTPNDPHYAAYQWDLRAGDGSMETVGSDTTAYANRGGADTVKAWNLADGQGVIVAVLDTGITHHPDLDTSLGDAGYDFISEAFISGRAADGRAAGGWDLGDWTNEEPWESQCTDAKSPPEASSWHGTHVSGTIAELTDNGVGLAGSAYDARVLPVRVLGHCGGRTSDIVDAIEWASGGHVDGISDNANPVSVISMSIGGTGTCSSSDATGVAIADAISRGVAVVVAAGNEGIDASNDSPASCPGAIAVASVGISGKRAFYSNFGSTVALAAPGGGMYANDASSGTPADYVEAGFVWSTVNGSATSPDESNYGYGGMAGTSQATPHVSGAVALVVGAVKAAGLPALTPAQIRSLLTSTARAFPTTPDQPVGAGIVDVNAAVTEAIGGDAGGGDGGNAGGATVLNNGDTLHGLAGAAGDQFLYQLDVPQGTSALVLRTFGGSGDVSLYAKRDVAPTTTDYERAAAHIGNNESVVITHPASGTYYLLISGVKAFNGLTLQASYVGGTP